MKRIGSGFRAARDFGTDLVRDRSRMPAAPTPEGDRELELEDVDQEPAAEASDTVVPPVEETSEDPTPPAVREPVPATTNPVGSAAASFQTAASVDEPVRVVDTLPGDGTIGAPPTHPIKAVGGTGHYFRPGDPGYEKAVASVFFPTVAAAEENGFTPPGTEPEPADETGTG